MNLARSRAAANCKAVEPGQAHGLVERGLHHDLRTRPLGPFLWYDVLLGSVDADINLSARLLEDDDSRLVSRVLPVALLDIAVMGFASLTVAEAKDRGRKVSKSILPRQLRELPMPRWRHLPPCRARFLHGLVDGVSTRRQLKATFPAEEFLFALGLHQEFALLDRQSFVAPLTR